MSKKYNMIDELNVFTTMPEKLEAYKWYKVTQLFKVIAYIVGTLWGTTPYLIRLFDLAG